MYSRITSHCLGFIAVSLLLITSSAQSQIKRTQVPLGDTLRKALAQASLTGENARPFHLRVTVSEPENPQSPYQGTIEEWWQSADTWRRVVTDKDGMRQTIVVAHGMETERDEGDYFPLWLRSFVTALFDPVPGAASLEASTAMIEQITLPNGDTSDACVRGETKVGSGDRSIGAYSVVCFSGRQGLKSIVTPRYTMEFKDFQKFGQVKVARRLMDDPEPGTELVGAVAVLEDLKGGEDLFQPLETHDARFQAVAVSWQELEKLTADAPAIQWPAVRSGNTSGRLAMYVSIDATGQVREAWPLNSDNAGLEDPAREQVRKWKLKPMTDKGQAVQVDGVIAFAFGTKVDNPLPVLTAPEVIGQQMSGCQYKPEKAKGVLKSGESVKIRLSVSEQGKLAGESFQGPDAFNVMGKVGLNPRACVFKPYMVDGKATYYYIDLVYTAP
jgi:hypothetical protein